MRPRRVPVGVAVALAATWAALVFLLYSLGSGITYTNDGSHYALVRALRTRGTAVLEEERRFAGHDIARYEARYFAGRDPGLAFAVVVFAAVAEPLVPGDVPLELDPYCESRMDDVDRDLVPVVMLFPALSGATLFLLVFGLVSQFTEDRVISYVVALAMVLGTIAVRYGTLLYSHIFTAALVSAGVLLLMSSLRGRAIVAKWCLSGACLGWAVITEPLVILSYLPITWFILRAEDLAGRRTVAALSFLGGQAPFALLIWTFNAAYFDHPFFGAYFHHAIFAYTHSVGAAFEPARGLAWLKVLLFGHDPFVSLLRTSLVSAVAGLAIPLFLAGERRFDARYALLTAMFLVVWAAGASYKEPFGGYDLDYRYVFFVVPLLAPLVAVPLGWAREKGRLAFAPALLVFVCLGVLSFRWNLDHVRHARQIQYPETLVNWPAAARICWPWAALGAACIVGWALVRKRPAGDEPTAADHAVDGSAKGGSG